MKITIPHRWRSTPVAVEDVPDDAPNPLRVAVEQANAQGADLTDAQQDFRAVRPCAVDQRLRYLAYAALGDSRYAFERVLPEERHRAIRCCADELQMIRLMSTPVRGSVRS